MNDRPAAPAPATPERDRGGWPLALLPLAGLLTWFLTGLPWGPHIETFDWMVRLETMSLGEASFAQLPSVLSLRPLGIGLAWLAYHAGGREVALAQFVNGALTLLAWWWLGRAVRERRAFALAALAVGGACFAGYIYVFHLHGVFYAPLLLYLAALVHVANRPLAPRALLGVLALTAAAALFHPFALVLGAAFAAGALAESRALRTPAGWGAAAAVLAGAAVLYAVLVPPSARGPEGDPLHGWRTTFATTEVNRAVSLVAAALAVFTARGLGAGRARLAAVALVAAAAAALWLLRWPVLPLWLAVAGLASLRSGGWALAAVLGACLVLPAANPTGSPTYAVFGTFLAAALAARHAAVEERLGWLRPAVAAAVLVACVALGVALRAGVPVPVASGVARPLVAERERTTQFPVLLREYLASEWGGHPLRFARGFERPAEGDAVDRRFRPPTNDIHLATWLAHLRGGAPAEGETLYVAFGGDPLAAGPAVLAVRGRTAGDALVFRRASADSAGAPRTN